MGILSACESVSLFLSVWEGKCPGVLTLPAFQRFVSKAGRSGCVIRMEKCSKPVIGASFMACSSLFQK